MLSNVYCFHSTNSARCSCLTESLKGLAVACLICTALRLLGSSLSCLKRCFLGSCCFTEELSSKELTTSLTKQA